MTPLPFGRGVITTPRPKSRQTIPDTDTDTTQDIP
ncbi:hypothetical protein JOD60_002221 [Microbacterium aurum]|nr:hypothetical protein [Microbacterium aurum]